jgi:hypothetical protein
MRVVVTIVLIVAIAMWTVAVYSRLVRLRNGVTRAWQLLEADQSNDAIRAVYNKHVDTYNQALANFPANVIGAAAGFKPARRF